MNPEKHTFMFDPRLIHGYGGIQGGSVAVREDGVMLDMIDVLDTNDGRTRWWRGMLVKLPAS